MAAPTPARPQSARSAGTSDERPEWRGVSAIGRNFGEPPFPVTAHLQPKPMPPALQGKVPKLHQLARFQVEDGVKLIDGVPDTNEPGKPPTPRSACIERVDLADMNSKPRQVSQLTQEVVYLVHCDSTDTTCAAATVLGTTLTASLAAKPFTSQCYSV